MAKRTEQLALPLKRETAQINRPPRAVVSAAQRFAAEHGRTYDPHGLADLQVDPLRGHLQALAYMKGYQTAGPPSPETTKSFDAMKNDIEEQYDFMIRPKEQGGMGMTVSVHDTNPYPEGREGRRAMLRDIARGHIAVESTKATSGGLERGHAHWSNEINDKFRAAHDLFGHAATGRNFSRHGEEAAYRSHAMMFSPEAQMAVASETRGQNSVLNFHPTHHDFLNQETQIVGVPHWFTDKGPIRAEDHVPAPRRQHFDQGRLF